MRLNVLYSNLPELKKWQNSDEISYERQHPFYRIPLVGLNWVDEQGKDITQDLLPTVTALWSSGKKSIYNIRQLFGAYDYQITTALNEGANTSYFKRLFSDNFNQALKTVTLANVRKMKELLANPDTREKICAQMIEKPLFDIGEWRYRRRLKEALAL